jgi:hypothetical protein
MAELDGTTPENAAIAGIATPTLSLLKPADTRSNGQANDNDPAA